MDREILTIQEQLLQLSSQFLKTVKTHATCHRNGQRQAANSGRMHISFLCEQISRLQQSLQRLESTKSHLQKLNSQKSANHTHAARVQTTLPCLKPTTSRSKTTVEADCPEFDNVCDLFGFSDALRDLLYAPYSEAALINSYNENSVSSNTLNNHSEQSVNFSSKQKISNDLDDHTDDTFSTIQF